MLISIKMSINSAFLGPGKPRMLFYAIDGILTFMSRKKFMLSGVGHEKSFITSGAGFKS